MISSPLKRPSGSRPSTFEEDNEYWVNVYWDAFISQFNNDIAALNFGNLNATSTTSVLIGTGSKTFTIQTGKGWTGGMWGIAADAAAPSTNSMQFQVTSYNSGTGVLVVNVPAGGTLGSGTLTNWVVSWTPPGGLTQTALTALLQNQSATGFTAAGTQPIYTVTTGYGALAAGQRLRVIFPTVTTLGAQPTLNRDGLGAINVVQYDGNGTKQRGRILIANQRCDLEYDGTDFVILNPIRGAIIDLSAHTGADVSLGVGESAIYSTASVATQALRIATGANQIYDLTVSERGTFATHDGACAIRINNVDYAGAVTLQRTFVIGSTVTTDESTVANLLFGFGGFHDTMEATILTGESSGANKYMSVKPHKEAGTTNNRNILMANGLTSNAVAWTSLGTFVAGRTSTYFIRVTRRA